MSKVAEIQESLKAIDKNCSLWGFFDACTILTLEESLELCEEHYLELSRALDNKEPTDTDKENLQDFYDDMIAFERVLDYYGVKR